MPSLAGPADRSGKTVIIAVDTVVYGAGLSLAVASDFVLASPRATFCSAFVRLGYVPDVGTMYLPSRRIGLSRAKEMAFSGRAVGVEDALQICLVHSTSQDDVLAEVLALAERFCHALHRSLRPGQSPYSTGPSNRSVARSTPRRPWLRPCAGKANSIGARPSASSPSSPLGTNGEHPELREEGRVASRKIPHRACIRYGRSGDADLQPPAGAAGDLTSPKPRPVVHPWPAGAGDAVPRCPMSVDSLALPRGRQPRSCQTILPK